MRWRQEEEEKKLGEIQAFKAGSGVKLSVGADPTCVCWRGTMQGTGNMESSHKSYLTGKVYGSSEYSRGDGCQVFLHNRGSFVSTLPLGSSPHATAGNFLSILRRAAGLEQGSSPTFLFRLCFFNAEPCPKQDIPVYVWSS